ncbi:hypothetical protein CU024_0357 [Enterococcus faecium]|nr:hypothetical protein [Enterococcus faecium]MBK4756869.1 hypothetical protein [Enterococcus faecium]MBK4763320.1 hypothetical protein [Enterococcus faecium]MBK4781241.1 hypothetical protein [Enterococcus faecium]MBK4786420.1 hypothetical protein [Enterococcus faecium]
MENGNQRQKQAYPAFWQKATQKNPQRLSYLSGLRKFYFYIVEI